MSLPRSSATAAVWGGATLPPGPGAAQGIGAIYPQHFFFPPIFVPPSSDCDGRSGEESPPRGQSY